MANSVNPNDAWETCTAGELRRLAADWRRDAQLESRRRRIGQFVAASALVVLIGGVAIWSSQSDMHGGLTCAECASHFDAYGQSLAGGDAALDGALDDATFGQVQRHLESCRSCREAFASRFPQLAQFERRERFVFLALAPLLFGIAIFAREIGSRRRGAGD